MVSIYERFSLADECDGQTPLSQVITMPEAEHDEKVNFG
jgi:hypothetical protein